MAIRDPYKMREAAAALSTVGASDDHKDNGDEKSPFVFSFRKGLGHGLNGLLVNPTDFEEFKAGTEAHDPAIFEKVDPFRGLFFTQEANDLPEDMRYREWESPTAGHAYVLEGPDPQTITMPPAPKIGSAEFAAEIAEVYQMALARDWCVAGFMDDSLIGKLEAIDDSDPDKTKPLSKAARDKIVDANKKVDHAAKELSRMRWFKGQKNGLDTADTLKQRRRRFEQEQTANTLFRGAGEDTWATPFLSQFMVMGSGGTPHDFAGRSTGRISYGAQSIDQRVNVAIPGKDYMTTWLDYVDVQNGANLRKKNSDEEILLGKTRSIATVRDLATYVHDDALYQAYLNAALILLGEDFPFDPGIPFHKNSDNGFSKENREPFALFGGPHLLTLVTEVSSRVLKAVRYQKFSIHRRLRPEATGALLHTVLSGYEPHRDLKGDSNLGHMVAPFAQGDGSFEAKARQRLGSTVALYVDGVGQSTEGSEPALEDILTKIRKHNAAQNKAFGRMEGKSNWLLPMAFREGSPMHPAYGAGHATVAGACVTLLKAFFAMSKTDMKGHKHPVYLVKPGDKALVPECPGTTSNDASLLALPMHEGLTLESELNKLIWNISNARNMAGVHYYTDYIESALLGEAMTIGILREQMLCYHANEKVTLTVPLLVPRTLPETLLEGSSLTPTDIVSAVTIKSDGSLEEAT